MKKQIIISILVIVALVVVVVYSNAEVSREVVDEKTYTIEEATKYNNWPFGDVYGIKVYQNYFSKRYCILIIAVLY